MARKPDEILVPHRRLFDADLANDVGTVKAGAKKLLERLRARGQRIVIVGEITDSFWGTKALTSAMYDHDLPFDEIDQCGRWKTPTS